jgi:hypothetical protein
MDLFSPLSRNYCLYFYFLSILGFALMVVSIGFGIFQAFSKKKPINYGALLMIASGYFVVYFQNRLLYGMCVGSGNSGAAATTTEMAVLG